MGNGERDQCAGNINSLAEVKVSRRDLVRLRDHLSYLQSSLKEVEADISNLQRKISKLSRDGDRMGSLFDSLFLDQISSVTGEGTAPSLESISAEEKLIDALDSELITLGDDGPTHEQILSIIDMLKRIEDEVQGPAPKEEVLARAKEININPDRLDLILAKLKRAGALAESEGSIRLI